MTDGILSTALTDAADHSGPAPARTFVDRHIGPDEVQQLRMLKTLGFDSIEQLMGAAVPKAIRSASALDLPEPVSEEAAAA
jgi:glycine dehydrogenase